MIQNYEAIEQLHKISDFKRHDGGYAKVITEEDALACDLGASAIKTIDDMSDVFQKLITLTPDDIDTLTAFLKTHSVSEIVTTLDYINSKCHLNSLYGKMVYADTDSVRTDVSRETPNKENHSVGKYYTDSNTERKNT